MSGHKHDSSAGTQNQGNTLGDRSCVRQSRLYRMHESGNDIKSILGTPHLCWDTRQKQGAYDGQKVFDHTADNPHGIDSKYQQNRRRSFEGAPGGAAPFARDDDYGSSKRNDYSGANSRGYDSRSGYGDNSYGYGASNDTQYRPSQDAYSNEDYGDAKNSLGNYSQSLRRQKQLQDLPPNPYSRRNDENARDVGNARGGDEYNSRLSQMRDMKEQIDSSAYRGSRGGGNSNAGAVGYSRGSSGRDDRSTRPW